MGLCFNKILKITLPSVTPILLSSWTLGLFANAAVLPSYPGGPQLPPGPLQMALVRPFHPQEILTIPSCQSALPLRCDGASCACTAGLWPTHSAGQVGRHPGMSHLPCAHVTVWAELPAPWPSAGGKAHPSPSGTEQGCPLHAWNSVSGFPIWPSSQTKALSTLPPQ